MDSIKLTASQPAARLRPQLAAGPLVLGLALVLGGCQSNATSPNQAKQPATGPILSRRHHGGLYFDERYLDSLRAGPPYSARTLRQKEINKLLGWMELTQEPVPHGENPNDSTSISSGGEPTLQFANRQQLLNYIHRRIDSLKVLEHIPLTPH